jgi:hypothetical protein
VHQLAQAKDGFEFSQEFFQLFDQLNPFLSILYIIGILVFLVIYFIIIHQVNNNSWHISERGTGYSNRWAVGCFFVPIVNLYKPYGLMKELVLTSQRVSMQKKEPDLLLVKMWWTIEIISIFVSRLVSNFFSKELTDMVSYINYYAVNIASLSFDVLLYVSTFILINRIIRYQREKHTLRAAEQAAVPAKESLVELADAPL